MSYLRANTDNPNGWRPGTVRTLGELRRLSAPDWKASAAAMDHAQRVHQMRSAAGRHAQMVKLTHDDAVARGLRPARPVVRRRGMSGLGLNAIDLNSGMVPGAPYTFHFTASTILGLDPGMIAQSVATDANFLSPTVMQESGGFQVSFIYGGPASDGKGGPGATVQGAASELQSVLGSHAAGIGVWNTVLFRAAEGGLAAGSSPATPVFNPVTTPGQQELQPQPPGTFNLSTFIAGLGTGGAIALGVGLFLLLK